MFRHFVLTLIAGACLLFSGKGLAPATAEANHGCPEGHPLTGDLGIGLLQCPGGSCVVNERRRGEYLHQFSTEPRVWRLRPGSPAAAALAEGDFILAIDGELITTREGGRRLANLRPGVRVELRIRRDDKQLTVGLLPVPGCNMPSLAVTAGLTPGPPG